MIVIDLKAISDFCEGLTALELFQFSSLPLAQQNEVALGQVLSRECQLDLDEDRDYATR